MIQPTGKLNPPIGGPPGPVARSVAGTLRAFALKSAAHRNRRDRIEIPQTDATSFRHQFTESSDRRPVPLSIENSHPRTADRAADPKRVLILERSRAHRFTGGEDRVFSRSVSVDYREIREPLLNSSNVIRGDNITAGEHDRKRLKQQRILINRGMKKRRGEPRALHSFPSDSVAHTLKIGSNSFPTDDRTSVQNRPPNFERRSIKSKRRRMKHFESRPIREEPSILNQTQNRPMGNHRPARLARGTRSEHGIEGRIETNFRRLDRIIPLAFDESWIDPRLHVTR